MIFNAFRSNRKAATVVYRPPCHRLRSHGATPGRPGGRGAGIGKHQAGNLAAWTTPPASAEPGRGHAMNVPGIISGFPLPDNKCWGQGSREGQEGGGKDRGGNNGG